MRGNPSNEWSICYIILQSQSHATHASTIMAGYEENEIPNTPVWMQMNKNITSKAQEAVIAYPLLNAHFLSSFLHAE